MKRCSSAYRVLMLFCSNSVLRLMAFAYRAVLLSRAGSEAMGLYSLIMQISAVVSAVCVYGAVPVITSVAARTEPNGIRRLFSASIRLLFELWTFCSFLLLLLQGSICAKLLHDPEAVYALVPLMICILLTGIENALKAIHMGTLHFSVCAFSEMMEQGMRILTVIVLLSLFRAESNSRKVTLITLGMLVSELVSVSILSVSFFVRFPKRTAVRGKSVFRDLSRRAFPSILTAVSGTLFSSAGALILPGALMRYGSDGQTALSQIGILNNASVPLTLLPMAFVGAVAAVLAPRVSSICASGASVKDTIKKAFAAIIPVTAVYSIVLVIWGDAVSTRLFGAAIGSAELIPLVLKAEAVFILSICVSALNGMLMQKQVLFATLFGESAAFLLIVILTPKFGLMGYTAGSAAGEVAGLITVIIVLSKKISAGYGEKHSYVIKSA